ncbi:unnamed protein product [Owenia fusiformis]|uniref:Uncharacterized protein n=1 Tax=Owenia fusiformis TaxID=6347 RepID=A0A8J1UIA1_OWEFU|nr:unnamed protein product [Owenia fusiformis]
MSLIMADTDYDNITEQLWYQDSDYIVHATTGLLLSSYPNKKIGLDFERNDTNQRWILEGNSTLTVASDSNMQLVVDESGNVSISKVDEGGQGANWEFAPFTLEGLPPCGLKLQERYFVIQHKHKPCYTLCAANKSMTTDTFDLVYEHYDFDQPGPCSWYEKGNHFVNVAFENVTIYTYLQNQEVVLNEWDAFHENASTWMFCGDEVVRLNATFNTDTHAQPSPNRGEDTGSWTTLLISTPTFFKDITCLYILPPRTFGHNRSLKCEELPWLLQNDIPLDILWYYRGHGKIESFDQNFVSRVINLEEDNDVEPMELIKVQRTCKRVFFIQNDDFPCSVLTYQNGISFLPYEFDRIAHQLWLLRDGALIHFSTGGRLTISPATLEKRNNQTIVSTTPCNVHVAMNDVNRWLECDNTNNSAPVFKVIPFEPDYVTKVQCVYFIQNQVVPCDTVASRSMWMQSGTCNVSNLEARSAELTKSSKFTDGPSVGCSLSLSRNVNGSETCSLAQVGYDEGEALKARPLLNELVGRQLFHWKEGKLVNFKTGLFVTVAASDNTSAILLENEDTPRQAWELINDKFRSSISGNRNLFLSVDVENDGLIKALSQNPMSSRPSYTTEINSRQSWSLIEIRKVMNDANAANCPPLHHGRQEPRRVFFIKHSSEPCLVLTATGLGEPPVFKIFDRENFATQVWFFENDHIINGHSRLSLMLDAEGIGSTRLVIMWHVYEYSRLQRWSRYANDFSINDFGTSYYLYPYVDSEGAKSVYGKLNIAHGRWKLIEMDDDDNFLQEVTCHFFLKNILTPWSYENVVVRPIQQELVYHQLWYFDDKRIRNLESDLYLTKQGNRLILTPYLRSSRYQFWRHASLQLILEYDNTYVGVEEGTGDITLDRWRSSRRQQWRKVDENVGNENPQEQLQCASQSTPELYVIRSENGDCPILTDDGTYAKVRNVESPSEKDIWVRYEDHVMNYQSQNMLSVRGVGYKYVYMKDKMGSHHQAKQHWRFYSYDGSIQSGYKHGPRWLTRRSSNGVKVASSY